MRHSKTWFSGLFALFLTAGIVGCATETAPSPECVALQAAEQQVAGNLKMYTAVWDDIINKGDLDKINETNFDANITMIYAPENVVGIPDFKAYYQNFVTGFSDVKFTIVDAFGQGDKLVKHWNFKGTHSGEFFGVPATGKTVDIDGVTLVRMKDGKIAQEQDFMDNLSFFQQLGLIPTE